MTLRKLQVMLLEGLLAICFIAWPACRRSGEADRASPEAPASWTLTLATPIDHLDVVAREPMIAEHPDGTLFVTGYGAAWISGKRTDEPTLWKSSDGGTSWVRVNVGTEADGAAGNSDPDLAVAGDGTLYFVMMVPTGRRATRSASVSARTWEPLGSGRFFRKNGSTTGPGSR